ncbi:MAG TPA: hypothetical protein VGG84_10340 [Gemmatimonadaceae bacterium]
MKDERLYGKFTLSFPNHRKIAILSDAAFRCLVEATLWSRSEMLDGLLPRRYALATWSVDVLAELCNNDDEKPSLIEVESGWRIHDYAEHQETKSEIEARRERNRAAGQKGGLAKAKRGAKRNGKQPASDALSQSVSREREREREISKGGYVSEVPHLHAETEQNHPDPESPSDETNEPPRFCARHMPSGTLERCGACAEARKEHDRWLAGLDIQAKARAQREGRELVAQRQAAAVTAAAEVANCTLCNDDGYRTNGLVCDHVDHAASTTNGRAAARAALADLAPRKHA